MGERFDRPLHFWARLQQRGGCTIIIHDEDVVFDISEFRKKQSPPTFAGYSGWNYGDGLHMFHSDATTSSPSTSAVLPHVVPHVVPHVGFVENFEVITGNADSPCDNEDRKRSFRVFDYMRKGIDSSSSSIERGARIRARR